MTFRKVVLLIHLYLGLVAAVFLAILGLTGSILAFEGDLNHWLRPSLWYVTPSPPPLSENDLIAIVQHQFPRTRVLIVQFFRASNLVQVMQLTNGATVYINPYDGKILGATIGLSNTDRILGYIHHLHLRLVPDPRSVPQLAAAGKVVVSIAGLVLCLMVPSGLILWWRAKRTTIDWKIANWKTSWPKVVYEAHQVIGVFAAVFLLIASTTGIMIGFNSGEKLIYWATRSSPPPPPQPWQSMPAPGAEPIRADQVLEIARRAMPNATIAMLVRPVRPAGSYTVFMRVPEETSETVHSTVTIDQYSGKVLNVRNFLTDSPGYRWIRFNRSIHTGDIFGLTTRVLVSLASLCLVAMVFTGLLIWWKKLAG